MEDLDREPEDLEAKPFYDAALVECAFVLSLLRWQRVEAHSSLAHCRDPSFIRRLRNGRNETALRPKQSLAVLHSFPTEQPTTRLEGTQAGHKNEKNKNIE